MDNPMVAMPKTAKEMLKLIDRFIEENARIGEKKEPMKLLAILSALRGPDEEVGGAKKKYTAYIRGRALPSAARWYWEISTVKPPASDLLSDAERWGGSDHYWEHIDAAMFALGAWGGNNAH